jgi:xylono-1,5-lactonase
VRIGRNSSGKATALDQVQPVWTGRAILGEGPLWSPRLDRLIFVDIRGSRLIAWSPTHGDAREWVLPEACCWLIERSDGNGFLAGLRTRIVHLGLDLITGPEILAELARPEANISGNRFNDAKADPWGRVWAGSMDDQEKEKRGWLYRIDPDGMVTRHDGPYWVANGPAISADGRTLFHTDSAAREIYAFDLSPQGELANKRVHIGFSDRDGYPDGMTIDAEGGLWIAHWDGACITRFDPRGRPERSIPLPCSRVTSCAFFGEELEMLAVTTACHQRGAEPLAGALFTLAPGVRGLPAARFGTSIP